MNKIPSWVIYLLVCVQIAFGAFVGTAGVQLPPWAMACGNAVGAVATWLALQAKSPKDAPDA